MTVATYQKYIKPKFETTMTGSVGFAECISAHIAQLVAARDPSELLQLLDTPEQAAAELAPAFLTELANVGIDVLLIRKQVREEPFLHLSGVFDPAGLPSTPLNWLPVPTTPCTLAARVAIVLLNYVCGMETVSYGSENGGALFVNLVTLDGKGLMVEKSRGPMKGHTDAATFPFRGTTDPVFPRIAPSPDVVFLAAFRNVEAVPTIVMPLTCALTGLPQQHAEVLKGPNLVMQAQNSFRRGAEAELGVPHILDGTHVLYDSPEGTWVRYSHSQSLVYDESDPAAVAAKASFEAACASCAQEVVLKAGDLLVVNNRKALHGRSPVGDDVGGQSRWLMRSYGLDTTGLADNQRHEFPRHRLYP